MQTTEWKEAITGVIVLAANFFGWVLLAAVLQ